MKRLPILIFSLLLTTVNFYLHTATFSDSTINNYSAKIDWKRIDKTMDLHMEKPAFKRRPLTRGASILMGEALGIKTAKAYLCLSYFLLFCNGFLVALLAYLLAKKQRAAYLALLLYHLAFPTLFYFFSPIYSFDEALQYGLLFCSFILFQKKQWLWATIILGLAAIARESSLFLLPGLWWIYRKKMTSKQGYFLIPIAIYSLFLLLFVGDLSEQTSDSLNRWSAFQQNFMDQKRSIESLFSLFLAAAWILPIIYSSKLKGVTLKGKNQRYVQAFLFTLLFNSSIVFFFAIARESRLFMLPMLFIWPVANEVIHIPKWKEALNLLKIPLLLMSIPFLIFIAYALAFWVYQPSMGKASANLFNEYLFILLLILSFYGLYASHKSRSKG